MDKRIAVVGGVNMDIGGSPAGKLIMLDSNPGHVSLRPGGVGRNIAHDLCLLGLDVGLVAALGGDLYGKALLASCKALGMDMELSLVLPEARSSVYLYVTDETGDMRLGISDMDIVAALTPARLAPRMDPINRADALVLDANLSEETIRYLAENSRVPLYVDPVSTAKAVKLQGVLDKLEVIKPNALEAEKLTGEKDPERAAKALLAAGVKRVFISLGAEGILAAQGETILRVPCEKTRVVNTNGAGDAATAALVWAGVHGLSLKQCARAAVLAGAAVAGSAQTNPSAIRAAFAAQNEE